MSGFCSVKNIYTGKSFITVFIVVIAFFTANPVFALEEINDVITDEETQEIELIPSEPKFEEKAIPLKIEKTDQKQKSKINL